MSPCREGSESAKGEGDGERSMIMVLGDVCLEVEFEVIVMAAGGWRGRGQAAVSFVASYRGRGRLLAKRVMGCCMSGIRMWLV